MNKSIKNLIINQVGFALAVFLLLAFTQPGLLNEKTEVKVLIETSLGSMKARLYQETPLHKANFEKNIKEGVYDSLLFHRVINEFMIQGGDPESKNADSLKVLGNGGLGYTVPAEFVPGLFHKKGALAAARTPDQVNPKKESSSSQFYIVHGKVFSDKVLTMMEDRVNQQRMGEIFNLLLQTEGFSKELAQVKEGMAVKNNQVITEVYTTMQDTINKVLDNEGRFHFSSEQRELYTTVGGAPHLDGAYTVFGEVYEGLEIIDKIAAVPCDQNNRPRKNVYMRLSIIEE